MSLINEALKRADADKGQRPTLAARQAAATPHAGATPAGTGAAAEARPTSWAAKQNPAPPQGAPPSAPPHAAATPEAAATRGDRWPALQAAALGAALLLVALAGLGLWRSMSPAPRDAAAEIARAPAAADPARASPAEPRATASPQPALAAMPRGDAPPASTVEAGEARPTSWAAKQGPDPPRPVAADGPATPPRSDAPAAAPPAGATLRIDPLAAWGPRNIALAFDAAAGPTAPAASDARPTSWAANQDRAPATAPAPPATLAPATAPAPPDEAPRFTITSIVVRGKASTAIINGRVVGIGDTIDGARVLAITAHAVDLDTGGRRLTLRM